MIASARLRKKVGELLKVLYAKRFDALDKLTLTRLLNKNPYLYRALGIADPAQLIRQVMVAFVSSSDETIFGNDFFEPLAVFAAQSASSAGELGRSVTVGAGAGQDIAIETATSYLAISVKSGKAIFNSQSTKGQSGEFRDLQARLKKLQKMFRPIVGYSYGRKLVRKASVEEKLAGQAFWSLLTGEPDFYLRISTAMAPFAGEHGALYDSAFDAKYRRLLREFMVNFVDQDGDIRWEDVVAFNSSESRPRRLMGEAPAADSIAVSH